MLMLTLMLMLMYVGGRGETNSTIKKKDAAAEIGRNPVSKQQIQPEYGE